VSEKQSVFCADWCHRDTGHSQGPPIAYRCPFNYRLLRVPFNKRNAIREQRITKPVKADSINLLANLLRSHEPVEMLAHIR